MKAIRVFLLRSSVPAPTCVLRLGMVFHLMSWLIRSEHGDSFLSDTVLVTSGGAEMLAKTSREIAVRA